MNSRSVLISLLVFFSLTIIGFMVWWTDLEFSQPERVTARFNGIRALRDVSYQTSLGPRTVGSDAHDQVVKWIQTKLREANWYVEIQSAEAKKKPIINIIARRLDMPPQIILAAHYDSRLFADHDPDPDKQQQPVPGANDGASGVAVLLELARTLPKGTVPIWLVFFDAEDNGGIPGWDWILGSRAFVGRYNVRPDAVVVIDMVGDRDLKIFIEKRSNPDLAAEIWAQAAELGYGDTFISTPKYNILDDHVPFLEAGIRAVDIIDMDYPYWHTTADTEDKVSERSLTIVGKILWTWVVQQSQKP